MNDRKNIKYPNVGLYGSAFDTYFYSENPFDFFMLQIVSNSKNCTDTKQLNEVLKKIRAKGKKAIIRIWFWDKYDEHALPLDEYIKRVNRILDNIDTQNEDIICFCEENAIRKNEGHKEILEDLYDYVKSKWPSLLIYQFVVPKPSVISLEKADGYIADFYGMEKDSFKKHIDSYLATKKPTVVFIEAANDRGWTKKKLDIMCEQVEICRKNNVAFGWYSVDARRNVIDPITKEKKHNNSRWGWLTQDPICKLIWQLVLEKTKEYKGQNYNVSAYKELEEKTIDIMNSWGEKYKDIRKPLLDKIILSEDFSSIKDGEIPIGWYVQDEGRAKGNWLVKNGILYQNNPETGYKCLLISPLQKLKNFSFEFKLKYCSTVSHLGVYFDYKDIGNKNSFIIELGNDVKFRVSSHKNGKWIIPTEFIPFEMVKDKWYKIEIIRKNNLFYVYIDDIIKYYKYDMSDGGGMLGLVAYNGIIAFDDIVISEIR